MMGKIHFGCPGANNRLTPQKIDQARQALEEAALLILQYEIPAETIRYVLDLAAEIQVSVLWNFAPARSFDLSYLQKVRYLVANEVEAEFLSGQKIHSAEDARQAAQIIQSRGANVVVVTLGEKGSFHLSPNEAFHTPAFQVQAVDTTGAGDVFCGALATALV
ncbi:MAG: ribokinase, partial [Bacteroidia bacterium]|nr:ribokinase [Bacteroidia bacterium]